MKKRFIRPTWFLITAILSFIVIIGSMYVMSRNLIIQKQMQILTLEKDATINEIESKINGIKSMILEIGSKIETQSDVLGLLDYLIDVDERYDVVSSTYFGMPNNTMINSSGFIWPSNQDLTQRPWYVMAADSDTVIFTDAFVNSSNDRVIITAAYAVYIDDVLQGVVGADIDIVDFNSLIDTVVFPDNTFGFLLDGNDQLIAQYGMDDAELLTLSSASDWNIPSDLLAEDNDITDTTSIDGVRGKIAYDVISGTHYTFGIFMSASDLNENTRIFWIISFAILLIIIAIGGSTIFIFHHYIMLPTETLTTDIKKISPEDGYRFRFSEDRGVGFGDARRAFNELLDHTVEYQNQAQLNYEELSLRNQKYNLLLDSAMDIVFQMDQEFRYTEVYGKGLSILKLKEKDMIGRTFSEVFGIELAKERIDHIKLAFNGSKSVYSWKYNNGEYDVYLESVISPLYDINDEIIGVVGVTRDITEQQERYEEMVYISNHDYLTGLFNRRYYIKMLEEMDRKKEYPFSVINIDFNGLKIINDAYGHAIGDHALIKTANILTKNSPDSYIISRVSGDEFTMILPGCRNEETDQLIEKLLTAFSRERIANIELSVAIGYYVKRDNTISIDEVRKLAENDMFRHKIMERKSVKNKAISAILKTLTEKHEAERLHSDRVAEFSCKLGETLGLSKPELLEHKTAALFHDIGKISIPDDIINKNGPLTKEEYEIMKSHTEVGYQILRAADEYSQLAIYASSHHERYDGQGYPNGLKGEDIPLFSRIISIADAFEAITSDRPYRKAKSIEFAANEIRTFAGVQFDPELARLFVEKVLHQPFD